MTRVFRDFFLSLDTSRTISGESIASAEISHGAHGTTCVADIFCASIKRRTTLWLMPRRSDACSRVSVSRPVVAALYGAIGDSYERSAHDPLSMYCQALSEAPTDSAWPQSDHRGSARPSASRHQSSSVRMDEANGRNEEDEAARPMESGWQFVMTAAAFNLWRMPKLTCAQTPVQSTTT